MRLGFEHGSKSVERAAILRGDVIQRCSGHRLTSAGAPAIRGGVSTPVLRIPTVAPTFIRCRRSMVVEQKVCEAIATEQLEHLHRSVADILDQKRLVHREVPFFEDEEELAVLQRLNGMRKPGLEVPQVTATDVVDEVAALQVDGRHAGAASQHERPASPQY